MKAFVLKSVTIKGCLLSPYPLNIVLDILPRVVRKLKVSEYIYLKGRNQSVIIFRFYDIIHKRHQKSYQVS